MIFLADENIDRHIVDKLREDGHTVLYIVEMSPGISNDKVLEIANTNDAVLLTADTDFGELVFRQKHLMSGVVLIRLPGLKPHEKAEKISIAVKQHASELKNSFSVIHPKTIRIRSHIT